MTQGLVAPVDLRASFLRSNPQATTRFDCDATRTVPAGGALAGLLLHDSVTPFQSIYRILPPGGIFSASRSRPVVMTIGAFTVPKQMGLALAEYRFRPYRFDGVVPGDAVPLEDRRLSLEIGNTLPLSAALQKGNIQAQIIPGPLPPPQQTTFAGTPNPGTPTPTGIQGDLATLPGQIPSPYASAGSISAGGPPPALYFPLNNPNQFVLSAQGAALIPQSNDPTQGSERLPFTYYVPENVPVSLQVTVFAPIRIPIAFFEGVLAGFLMNINTLQALLEEVRPCQGK
jgi:hypothetical protein